MDRRFFLYDCREFPGEWKLGIRDYLRVETIQGYAAYLPRIRLEARIVGSMPNKMTPECTVYNESML